MDRVFDPFFSTKETGQGTGLGLAVSARLIEGMGGTIRVESPVGSGACFSVLLPAARVDDQQQTEEA
jgi:two-component system NtrC family sensor kinase